MGLSMIDGNDNGYVSTYEHLLDLMISESVETLSSLIIELEVKLLRSYTHRSTNFRFVVATSYFRDAPKF